MKRDYYEILEVERDADGTRIKRAYRKVARECHPDLHPGDEACAERFKEATEAAEVLSDPQKRAIYDRYGHEGLAGVSGGASHDIHEVFDRFSDIFSDLFGGGGRARNGPRAGADLRYDLRLDFEQAAFGTKIELELPRTEACGGCEGSGAEAGTRPETCPACGGRGQVMRAQGAFVMSTTCPSCRGRGTLVRSPCRACGGRGEVSRTQKLPVDIPAGVDTGNRIRIAGQGEPGTRGGPPGNLYIVVDVAPHADFERDGIDVHSAVAIDYPIAALGGRIEVPTLHGPEKLDVPAGSQPGDVLKISGAGIPRVNARGRGAHFVHLKLRVPRALTREQKKLLRAFAETLGASAEA